MKKLILTLIIALTSISSAFAQHYRGFLDLNVAVPVHTTDVKFKRSFFGFTTSHGVQLNKLFVGAGVGAMFASSAFCFGMPIYADARWDFFSAKKTNFFVGLKLGYTVDIKVDDDYGIDLSEESYYDATTNYRIIKYAGFGGVHIQPSIGLRFRLNRITGINLTMSYLPLPLEKETSICRRGQSAGFNESLEYSEYSEYSKFWSHRIAFSVGLDF